MRYITAITAVSLVLAALGSHAQTPAAPSPWGVLARGAWGVIWASSPLVKVMRDTPAPTTQATGVRIYAASNEYEAFQLVLTPKKHLGNVKIVPHTLIGAGSARIAAWNISVKNVEYVNCTEPTSKDVAPGLYPDPLPDHTPFAAPDSTNSPVWITVYVAPKTPAGEYKGTIDVIASGMGKVKIPLSLHVWDFSLPSVSRLRTAYGNAMSWPFTYNGATTPAQQRKTLDLYNIDFFRHRVSPYAPYRGYDIGISTQDGAVKLDFADFDVAIDKYFPLFTSFKLPHFDMADDVGFGKGPDRDRMKIDYMRQVAEHLIDKGVLDKGYDYITDEPDPSVYSEIVEAAKLVRMADGRIKILLTKKVEDELIGSVDIWVPIGPDFDEARCKARQAKGEQVWWYLCCGPHHPWPNYFIDYLAIDLRMYHWMTWRYGLDGVLYWETCYWQDNPWEKPMSQPSDRSHNWGNGDGHLLYPATKTPSKDFVAKGPVDSIRWETIRDGIEDWDYFRILQDKIDATPAAKRSSPAYLAAQDALAQVNGCIKSFTDYNTDPMRAESVRFAVAKAIEGVK
jgi:hypothetical protein